MSELMDSNNLKALFQLVEEDREDKRLEKLLSSKVNLCTIKDSTTIITFYSGITIILIRNDFDGFNINISDKTFFRNNDTIGSKVSSDRVYMYLRDIAEGL